MKGLRFIVVGLIASLTACAVGPSYRTPKSDAPPGFASQVSLAAGTANAPAMSPSVDLASWWRALNDEELNSLVDRAVKSNLDLAIALDRLQQARTYEAVVLGNALPEVDASAAAGRGTGSDLTKGLASPALRSADT
jgi:outer membrane protein TolC